MSTPRAAVKVIALSQEHRGHGISTAAFYLGQTLAQQNVPLLLADLSGRHARLNALKQRMPTPRLVVWSPPVAAMRDVPAMLAKARDEVAGKASAILLDADLPVIDTIISSARTAPIDYLMLGTEHTTEGQKAVDRLANRYEAMRERNKIGVAFTRVSTEDINELPQQTNGELPVLGYWPADYRLAASDDFASDTNQLTTPHQPYLSAIARLATLLIRLVPLARVEATAAR